MQIIQVFTTKDGKFKFIQTVIEDGKYTNNKFMIIDLDQANGELKISKENILEFVNPILELQPFSMPMSLTCQDY